MRHALRTAQRNFKILTRRIGPVRVWMSDGTSVTGEVPHDSSGLAVNAGEEMTVVFTDREAMTRRTIRMQDVARLEMLPRRFYDREPKSPPWIRRTSLEAEHQAGDLVGLQNEIEALMSGYIAHDIAYFVERSDTANEYGDQRHERPMIRVFVAEDRNGPLWRR